MTDKLYFPERTLTDMFRSVTRFNSFEDYERADKCDDTHLFMSTTRGGPRGFYGVQVSDMLQRFIDLNMLRVNGGPLRHDFYAQVTYRDNGTVLVSLSNQSILGGRWLNVFGRDEVAAWFAGAEVCSD